jgi:dephospho-CoA kinase
MFAARGAALVDTDQIAHQLTQPQGAAMAPIEAEFGPEFVTPEGALDRARMRAQVFSDPAAKKRLEAILHPLIRDETERAARQAQGLYLMYVVPLLVESGSWKDRVSRVLVVDCPEQLQVARVKSRSGLAEAQIAAIMANQATRAQRLAVADDVIRNDADAQALLPQVDRVHALYLQLAAQHG